MVHLSPMSALVNFSWFPMKKSPHRHKRLRRLPGIRTQAAWYKAVRTAAAWRNDQGEPRGDLLFVVHGYNLSVDEVIQRHRRLKEDLLALGFKGAIASFDWPSDDKTLAYVPDRHRAKETAFRLVSDGIAYLSLSGWCPMGSLIFPPSKRRLALSTSTFLAIQPALL